MKDKEPNAMTLTPRQRARLRKAATESQSKYGIGGRLKKRAPAPITLRDIGTKVRP